ncbi:MAG: very short patch repair endonuclease [Prevotella sp.]
MDKMTKEQRHRTMASIRSKDTKPELIVRKFLWNRGFRYRLNNPRLPGHPDIVLKKYRTCIFVNGCFWHGHENCTYYSIPKTNTTFWRNKIERNKQRDIREQKRLAQMGWHCIIIWECELKPRNRSKTLESLAFTLNKIYLQDHTRQYIINEQNDREMVAEDLQE